MIRIRVSTAAARLIVMLLNQCDCLPTWQLALLTLPAWVNEVGIDTYKSIK